MKKLSDAELSAAFHALVAKSVTLSERIVTWTVYRSVRLPRSDWGNSWSSKYTEVPETRHRQGYFLADDEIESGAYGSLRALVKAYDEASALIVRLREVERVPGWEWIDHASRKAMYGDRLSELVPHARNYLESALGDLSLALSDAVSTARWRLEQTESHLPALATAKEKETAGYVPYFGGWLHTSGSNGRARYWVVQPDGTLRDPDHDEYSRSHRRGAHTQWWDLVEPDELGLWWSKATNASRHEFEVRKLPQGGVCTEAQLQTVAQLEDEIEAEWAGRRGLASGASSPSVGNGWGLRKRPDSELDPNNPFAILRHLKK